MLLRCLHEALHQQHVLSVGVLSRLHQIVEWVSSDSTVEEFDGVIVFDESHKAKNCMAKERDTAGASKNGFQAESKTSKVCNHLPLRPKQTMAFGFVP